jgi:hypothetical protein
VKPCVVGIGGCGGKVLKVFLQDQDVEILGRSLGEHISFGKVKGVWLESATQDAQDDKFYGRLEEGHYPGYLIPPEILKSDSRIFDYVADNYGYDLRSAGFDRRAEYLKAIFEIFETDEKLKELAKAEYDGEENPILAYIWRRGIKQFTILSQVSKDTAGKGDNAELMAQRSISEETKAPAEEEGRAETEQVTDEETIKRKGTKIPVKKDIFGKIATVMPKKVKPHSNDESQTTKTCDSILFIASLGGGTGTGFINPVTKYVRGENPNFPAFALGVLTEEGTDDRGTTEGQRDLGAVIAMYDLLTKNTGQGGLGVDGLILMDNEILLNRFKRNFPAINRAIFDAMRPFIEIRNFPDARTQGDSLAIKRMFTGGLKLTLPPVLVPCYSAQKRGVGNESDLVKKALYGQDGGIKLFDCDPRKADMAYVFTRGFVDIGKVRTAVSEHTGLENDEKHIMIYRKIGDHGSDDILILLRNPYGGDPDAYKRVGEGTFEKRIYGIVEMAIKHMREKEGDIITAGMPDDTKIALGTYLYGGSWLDKKLKKIEGGSPDKKQKLFKEKLKKAKEELESHDVPQPYLMAELEKTKERLERGDNPPFFLNVLNIFTREKVISAESKSPDMTKSLNNNVYVDEEKIRAIVREEIGRMRGLEQDVEGSEA